MWGVMLGPMWGRGQCGGGVNVGEGGNVGGNVGVMYIRGVNVGLMWGLEQRHSN